MKKFMFSAVALVAFSFAGMANTGGKEKDCKEVKKATLKAAEDITDCETAALIANAAYKECVKQGGKK